MKAISLICLLGLLPPCLLQAQLPERPTEVLVVGGGVGGTAAAIQSARMGRKTLLVEPTRMLGGMLTAAGVSCTDGNDQLPSGFWQEFRQALRAYYGKQTLASGWVSNTCFEPSVGDSLLKAIAAREKNLTIVFGTALNSLIKKDGRIERVVFQNTVTGQQWKVYPRQVIDATELGDLAAMAGVPCDIGMDDSKESGEKSVRQKLRIIQDLTWVAVLKDGGPDADLTIPRPQGYDSTRYFCCCTDAPCKGNSWPGDKWKMLSYAKLPGSQFNKYMINWPAHGNDSYVDVVDLPDSIRQTKLLAARQQTLGFIYFMQTALGMKNLGLAKGELDSGLALIPYYREGRRIRGKVRFAIHHIQRPYDFQLYRTGISVGDYPVDHHHGQYTGKVPGLKFPPIPSFTIPLGCLIPTRTKNLVVAEKAISVSNIVNGATRLQPVVLLTGQAAGVLAALAAGEDLEPAMVEVRTVQSELLKANCYLQPFVDVARDDKSWISIQRVASTGILRGEGKPGGWANKTFFYPDSSIREDELAKGMMDFEPGFSKFQFSGKEVLSIAKAWKMVIALHHLIMQQRRIPHPYPPIISEEWRGILRDYLIETDIDRNRPITRRELAVIIDHLAYSPFDQSIDLYGKRK